MSCDQLFPTSQMSGFFMGKSGAINTHNDLKLFDV